MSSYTKQLHEAQQRAREAFEAMEAWVNRPPDAPDVPGAVLEGYAKTLRDSREELQEILRQEGVRDDISAALAQSEEYHRRLGLTVRDRADEPSESEHEE